MTHFHASVMHLDMWLGVVAGKGQYGGGRKVASLDSPVGGCLGNTCIWSVRHRRPQVKEEEPEIITEGCIQAL